jgi:hypothetical protein
MRDADKRGNRTYFETIPRKNLGMRQQISLILFSR